MILAAPTPAATGAPAWSPVVDALRNELAEYGGLLQLVDEQQKKIFARDAAAVAEIVPILEQQAELAKAFRSNRETIVRQYAAQHGCPREFSLRQLLPSFPTEVRPLLEALIDEVNRLLQRTKQRTRQNHLMLGKLVELHQELIPALSPQSFTKTYSPHGQVAVNAIGSGGFRATG
jgi:flagellar biosynthesis/type III secretory pathway chaperone